MVLQTSKAFFLIRPSHGAAVAGGDPDATRRRRPVIRRTLSLNNIVGLQGLLVPRLHRRDELVELRHDLAVDVDHLFVAYRTTSVRERSLLPPGEVGGRGINGWKQLTCWKT